MSEGSGPRLGSGDVRIRLMSSEGQMEEHVLHPSYHAAKVLSAQTGGIWSAMERAAAFDVDVIASVVSLGLGYGVSERPVPKDLAERVWRTGLSDESGGLSALCIDYLRALMSGGRLPEDGGEGAGGGEEDPQAGAG